MIPNRREFAMATFFRKPDRRQRFLLPVDMQDWLPESDFVHLVLDAVEQMDLTLALPHQEGDHAGAGRRGRSGWRAAQERRQLVPWAQEAERIGVPAPHHGGGPG